MYHVSCYNTVLPLTQPLEFHLIVSDMSSKVQNKQQTQKFNHDQRARSQTSQVGDTVNVCNFPTGDGWLPGIIVEANGPLSFRIKL